MTRRFIQTLVLGLAMGTAGNLAFAPRQAQATVFAQMSLEQFVDASTYIVEGEVLRVWTEVDEGGYIWTRAQVAVSATHKGPNTPDVLIIDSLGGEHEGQKMVVHGAATYSVGQNAMFFLTTAGIGESRLVPVAKYLGVRNIRRAPGESTKYTQVWSHDLANAGSFDHRFVPHAAAAQRVYLDDLRTNVKARLQVGWDGTPIPGLSADDLREINTLERRIR